MIVPPGTDFRLPMRNPLLDSVRVTVSAGPDYHGVTFRVAATTPVPPLSVVLVPARWRIRGGAYDGRVVSIDPAATARPTPDRSRFLRVEGRSAGDQDELVGWPADRFPIPLALKHDGPVPLGAGDSVTFWGAVRQFEWELGWTAFRPADAREIDDQGWGADARIDPTIAGIGLTYITWTSGGTVFEASVAVKHRRDLSDPGVIDHELLHALGFGHAADWPTMMTRVAVPGRDGLTVEDVAYAQLLLRIRQLELTSGSSYGISAAR